MSEEIWKRIPEFPNYQISNAGRVYNSKKECFMSTSINNFGHVKLSFLSELDGERYTRSIAQLVAEAFIPNDDLLADQVLVLDGDFSNLVVDNLAWRPRWFVWKYTHQLKSLQPMHYINLPVTNLVQNILYECIADAGMNEGLLFEDIWRSTYTGYSVYPNQSVFKIVQRV